MDFLVGGTAAVCAGVFTNPLEVIKTRMQLQGELKSRKQSTIHFRNTFHAAWVIARTEGILALQRGLQPALWTQLFLNGLRLGTYGHAESRGLLKDKKGEIMFHRSVFFGGLGGGLGGAFCNPFFLVKTQLQSQANQSIAVGTQHNHKNMWTALESIYSKHGIKGLFRGVQITTPRAVVGSTAQLTSFSYCKQWLNERKMFKDSPIMVAFFSSMVGGICISLAITPLDLLSLRIQNQAVDARGKGLLYDGIFDCIVKIWRTEGFRGFYKGLFPNYIRLGPHTVLCLVFFEQLKLIEDKYMSNNLL